MTDEVHAPLDPVAAREAAATRYTLQRLMNRRSVRAALALSALRSKDSDQTWRDLWRGELPREDVISPVTHTFPVLFNELSAIATGAGLLTAAGMPTVSVTAHTYRQAFHTLRPNLVVVDSLRGWAQSELDALTELAGEHGVPVATIGPDATDAVVNRSVAVSVGVPFDSADLVLGPRVDIQQFNPVGMYLTETANVTSLNADGQRVDVQQARSAPVVTVTDPDSYGPWRVLELISSGALVLTGESAVLRDVFETDADHVVGGAQALMERRDVAFANPAWRDDVSVRLRRRIYRNASTYGAAAHLVSHLSLANPVDERVSVLLATRRGGERLRQVLTDLANQTYLPYEVIVIGHGDVDLDGFGGGRTKPKIRKISVDATVSFGAALNAGLATVTSPLVAKIDDDDRYGPHHLEDLVHSWRYSGASLVGRRAHAVYDETRDVTIAPSRQFEERFDDHLPGGTLLTTSALLKEIKFRHVASGIDTELLKMVHARGGSAYSSHRFGYVRVRHGDHTYTPPDGYKGDVTPGFDARWLGA
jgi:cellulose synthase/poly-beta-1,6-N-acetylglucosamine synthase-like glycosyltransferase